LSAVTSADSTSANMAVVDRAENASEITASRR
jgi:hypothetical protein